MQIFRYRKFDWKCKTHSSQKAKGNIRVIKVSLTRSFLQQPYYTRADVINSYRPACATGNIVFLDITKYDVTFWNRCLEISEIE